MCNKIELYGVLFDNYDREKLTKRLKDVIFGFERGYLVTPNPYILEQSRKDSDLYEALCDALLCIADGVGVKIASRILGKGLLHRIPGIEIGEMVLSLCAENQKAVYLLGGEDGVAAGASMALIDKYTGLLVAGYHHGYFSDCDSERIINLINESGAEVLYVCLGSPRQEKWIAENIENLPSVKLALCIGGSLDVYSGKIRRAPYFVRALSLEWLWRVLWSYRHFKRLHHIPMFLLRIIKQRFAR